MKYSEIKEALNKQDKLDVFELSRLLYSYNAVTFSLGIFVEKEKEQTLIDKIRGVTDKETMLIVLDRHTECREEASSEYYERSKYYTRRNKKLYSCRTYPEYKRISKPLTIIEDTSEHIGPDHPLVLVVYNLDTYNVKKGLKLLNKEEERLGWDTSFIQETDTFSLTNKKIESACVIVAPRQWGSSVITHSLFTLLLRLFSTEWVGNETTMEQYIDSIVSLPYNTRDITELKDLHKCNNKFFFDTIENYQLIADNMDYGSWNSIDYPAHILGDSGIFKFWKSVAELQNGDARYIYNTVNVAVCPAIHALMNKLGIKEKGRKEPTITTTTNPAADTYYTIGGYTASIVYPLESIGSTNVYGTSSTDGTGSGTSLSTEDSLLNYMPCRVEFK